jgi:GTP cyclohydrolase I
MSFEAIFEQFVRQVRSRTAHQNNGNGKGLIDTPRRASDAWAYWLGGYALNPIHVLKEFDEGNGDNREGPFDEMILQSGIRFASHCEHHLTPFFGIVHIGYVPRDCKYIVGLSKLARCVDIYARRLQVQERLTTQIAEAMLTLDPIGVGVVVEARHLCLETRGVRQPGTITTTSALRGAIKDVPEARREFLSFAHGRKWNGV